MADEDERAEAARRLIELAREMTEYAKQRGLTPEMLEEILREKD